MTDDSKSLVPHLAGVQWYYDHDGAHGGPISEESLQEEARRGKITPDTLVWQAEYDGWLEASRVPMLAAILGCPGEALHSEPNIRSSRVAPIRPPAEDAALLPGLESITEPAVEDLVEPAALSDAVSEEEAADTVIDFAQAREILERASQLPPEPLPTPERSGARAQRSSHPSEPWIPPASVASTPAPATDQATRRGGIRRSITTFVGCAAAGAIALAYFVRHHPEPRRGSFAALNSRPVSAITSPLASARPNPASSGPSMLMFQSNESQSTQAGGNSRSIAQDPRSAGDSAPTPASSVAVTEGPLDASIVESRLERALPVFETQCWQRYRTRTAKNTKDPSVRIEFSVDRSGRVSAIESSKAPPGYRGVGLCIIGRMRGWRFPRADQNSHAVVTIPRAK